LAEHNTTAPPFFILGRERSGTTLLRQLLHAHPNISVAQESPFLLFLYPTYHKQKIEKGNLKAFVEDLYAEPYFPFWEIDKQALQAHLQHTCPMTFAEACQQILCFKAPVETSIVGDKNPIHTLFAKRLHTLYPEARFLIMVRHPLAQVNSMLKVNFERKNIASLAVRWKKYAKSVLHFQAKHPKLTAHVQHEKLTADPEKELQSLCRFLGIPYSDKMIADRATLLENDATLPKEHHSNLHKPISAAVNEEWKTALTPKQQAIVVHLTRKTAAQFGYALPDLKLNLLQRVGTWPGQLYGYAYFPFLRWLNNRSVGFRKWFFNQFIAKHFDFWKNNPTNKSTD